MRIRWQKLYGRKNFCKSLNDEIYGNDDSKIRELKKFKKKISVFSPSEITEKLKRFSEFRISNTSSYRKRRRKHFSVEGKCQVCKMNNANCQHHIILLSHGGSNGPHNRINICEVCHADIHSWLDIRPQKIKSPTDPLLRDFKLTIGATR